MFIFNKILIRIFSLGLWTAGFSYQLSALHKPRTRSTYAWTVEAVNRCYARGDKRVYFVSFTIQMSNLLFRSYLLQSGVRSTVFESVTAVADKRAVISCARRLNFLSGEGWCSLKYWAPLLLLQLVL